MAPSIRIRIPETEYKGLSLLLRLPEEKEQELIAAIQQTSPTRRPRDYATKVANKVAMDADDVATILRVLFPLQSVRTSLQLSVPDFIELLIEAMKDTEAEELKFDDSNVEDFKVRLSALLDLEGPEIVSKASDLVTEHERTTHRLRVLTDLRPIFRSDSTKPPVAAVIIHQLKIVYHDGDELKEFFVGLNPNQISQLQAMLKQAEAEANSIKALMETASVPVLEGISQDELSS